GRRAAVGPPRGAGAVEECAVVCAAPAGARDLPDTQPLALPDQLLPQIDVPGPRTLRWLAAPDHDLRTNFIARPANAYAKMHYNIGRCRSSSRQQAVQPDPQDATGCAAPARVEQSDS